MPQGECAHEWRVVAKETTEEYTRTVETCEECRACSETVTAGDETHREIL